MFTVNIPTPFPAMKQQVISYTLVLFRCFVDNMSKIHCPKLMHSFIHLSVCLGMNDKILFGKKDW